MVEVLGKSLSEEWHDSKYAIKSYRGSPHLTKRFSQLLNERAVADPGQPSGQRAYGGLNRKVSRIGSLREANVRVFREPARVSSRWKGGQS
jgi:hypothetical protein